jgi:hypothetical protein
MTFDSCKMKYREKLLSLCLINQAPRHEDIWGSGGIAPPYFTSILDGGEWSASRPFRFTPREIAPRAHWIGGWVGPRVDLDAVEKGQILPLSRIKPRSSNIHLVAISTELSRPLMNYSATSIIRTN